MSPLSEAALARIDLARRSAETPGAALLTALSEVQRERARVGPEEVAYLADLLGLPAAHVQGVARFYDRITRQPTGRHVVALCEGISCYLCGSDAVAEAIGRALGVGPEETTPDGRCTFRRVACIGACERAPAALLGDEMAGPLEAGTVAGLLESLTGEGGHGGADPHR